MAGLVPAIHAFPLCSRDVDARDKRGHDRTGNIFVRANDALSGLVIIVLSLAMIALTLSFPAFPGQKYGPALFPRILGTGLILCGAALIWHGLAARHAGEPWWQIAPWVREPRRVGIFLLVIGVLVLYVLFSEAIGFIPLAMIFLVAMFLWLGVKPINAVVIALVATFVINWFFASQLRVPLPRGILLYVL
jgi:putative tricarboxylic transport membrane protein